MGVGGVVGGWVGGWLDGQAPLCPAWAAGMLFESINGRPPLPGQAEDTVLWVVLLTAHVVSSFFSFSLVHALLCLFQTYACSAIRDGSDHC